MTPFLSDIQHYEKVRDGWLLDTSVVSALVSGDPLPRSASAFFEHVADTRFHLSVITLGEVHRAHVDEPLPKPISMEALLESPRFKQSLRLKEIAELWSDRIHPVDAGVAYRWGGLLSDYAKLGVPAIDILIAATAAEHNLVVVTRDAGFRRMRHHVSVYDPWAPAPFEGPGAV